jgi:hypothetical protein
MTSRITPTTYLLATNSPEAAQGVVAGWAFMLEELGKQFDVVLRIAPTVEIAAAAKTNKWLARMRVAFAEKLHKEPRLITITTAYYQEGQNDSIS